LLGWTAAREFGRFGASLHFGWPGHSCPKPASVLPVFLRHASWIGSLVVRTTVRCLPHRLVKAFYRSSGRLEPHGPCCALAQRYDRVRTPGATPFLLPALPRLPLAQSRSAGDLPHPVRGSHSAYVFVPALCRLRPRTAVTAPRASFVGFPESGLQIEASVLDPFDPSTDAFDAKSAVKWNVQPAPCSARPLGARCASHPLLLRDVCPSLHGRRCSMGACDARGRLLCGGCELFRDVVFLTGLWVCVRCAYSLGFRGAIHCHLYWSSTRMFTSRACVHVPSPLSTLAVSNLVSLSCTCV